MSNSLTEVRAEGDAVSPFRTNSDQQEGSPAEPSTENDQEHQESPSHQGEEDTSSVDSPDVSDNTEASSKPDAFNKHPRFREMLERQRTYQEENKQLRDALDALAKQQREFFERVTPRSETQGEPIPDWFVEAYGDNPKAWEVHQRVVNEQREAIKRDLQREQLQQAEMQEKESKEMNEWVDKSIEATMQKYNVDLTKDQDLLNRVIKFALEFKPTDEEGNISLPAAYEIYSKLNPNKPDPALQAKKALASDTMKQSAVGSQTKDFFTPNDLRKGWKSIASNK